MSEDRDDEQGDAEQAEVARQEAAQQAKEDEQAVREETGGLAKEGDRMEERLDGLDDSIDEAKKVAAQRQDAPDPKNQVAGDWEGEASGADQGDDATDSGDVEDGDDGDGVDGDPKSGAGG